MEAPSGPVDRLFAEFLRAGDPEVLGEVYDAVAPRLLRLAIHLVRDPAEAEDVLQATFVAALERSAAFEPGRPVLPWLTGILGVEARRARARHARTPDPRRVTGAPAATDPAQDAERAELLERLDASLERLPEAFRAVLVLRLRHELTVPEIAAALGRAPGTVRSQLARGTDRLRTSLPAGLARALLAWTGVHGRSDGAHALAAVREHVLAQAARFPGPWTLTTATGLGGLIAMKKLVVAAVAAVAALVLWSVARTGARSEVAGGPRADRAAALVAAHAPPERTPVPSTIPTQDAPAETRVPAPAPRVLADAPASSPAPTGSLEVVATWPGGEPAAGEVVEVRDVALPAWTPALELRTDADGRARAELAPGHYFCASLRGGESTHAVELHGTTVARFELRAGLLVHGTVVDADGLPVPGAEIWMSNRYRTDRGVVVTHSDARGTFEVRGLAPDHHLGARKAGHAPSTLRTARGGAGAEVSLTLELLRDGARLVGHVLDDDGAPLEEASFLLGSATPGPGPRLPDGSFAPPAPPQIAWTDAQGRFEIPWAPLGPSTWQARATGHGLARGTVDVLATLGADVEVRLAREARVTGRVTDASGSALGAVWIHAGQPGGFDESRAWSAPDGTFELAGLPAGSIELAARTPAGAEARETVVLRAGTTREWNPVPRLAGLLHGVVRDELGQPLAGRVVIARETLAMGSRSRSQRTDAEGRFRLTDLGDVAHEVWVQDPMGWREFPQARLEDVWPDGPPLEIVVPDRQTFARLRLEVVDEDGVSVEGAELQVWHEEQRLWRSLVATEAGGPILVEHVPPGHVQLEVRHPDHPWRVLGTRAVVAGQHLDLGRVTLATPARLLVQLHGPPPERLETLSWVLTDEDGRESGVLERRGTELTSGPLPAGPQRLTVRGDFVRMVRRDLELRAGVEQRVDLELEPCGLREVRFTLPADRRPRWIALSLLDGENTLAWSGNADPDGSPPTARVSAPPGVYVLRVGAEGDLEGRATLVIESTRGAGPPLTVALAPR